MNQDTLNIMAGMRAMALHEIAQIEAACTQSTATAHAALSTLPSQMRVATSRALDTLPLADGDLAPASLPATQARLGRCLAGATSAAVRGLGVEIQTTSATALAAQADQLNDFAITCDTLLDYVRRTLLRPGAAPPSAAAPLTERMRALQATYAAAAHDIQPAPFWAGDLGAALAAREIGPTLAALPLPGDAGGDPQKLKPAYRAAAHAAIDRLASAEVVSSERAATNLIAVEFRELALQVDGFLDAQWHMLSELPASAFQAAPPIAAPMTYEPTPPASTATLCVHCGTELRSGHRFCHVCGAPTQPAAASPPPPAERMTTCSNCGALIKPGQRFCGSCGTTFAPAAAPPPPASPPVEPPPISPELLDMVDLITGARPDCAQCGNPLKPGEKFCGRCGAPARPSTPDPAAAQPDPGPRERPVKQPAPAAKATYSCPRCGVRLDPDVRICPSCGLVGPLLSDKKPAAKKALPTRPIAGASTPTPTPTLPCSRCGKPVAADAPWCPHCGVPRTPTPTLTSLSCSNCGKPVEGDALWCPHCGASRDRATG
jgi:predicted amidophosphoribosyltransferase